MSWRQSQWLIFRSAKLVFPCSKRQPGQAGCFYYHTCRRYSTEQNEKRSESIRQEDWMSSKEDNRGLVSHSQQGAQSSFRRWTGPRKRISCFALKINKSNYPLRGGPFILRSSRSLIWKLHVVRKTAASLSTPSSNLGYINIILCGGNF